MAKTTVSPMTAEDEADDVLDNQDEGLCFGNWSAKAKECQVCRAAETCLAETKPEPKPKSPTRKKTAKVDSKGKGGV
jgi:hypothetical protein